MDQAVLIEVAQGHIRSVICKLTNSEPSSLYLARAPNRCYSSAFITKGPCARQLGTTDTLQNPSILFKLANPNCSSFSAVPFFSCGSPNKGGGPKPSPCFCLLPPGQLVSFQDGPAYHLMPPLYRISE